MLINLKERIDISRASSGNIEKLFHGSSSYGYRIGIDWKVNSQSVSGNSSNVTATVYLRTTGSGVSISSSATKDVSVTINGTKYLGTTTAGIGVNSKKNLLSKTVTVGHNSDGSKTCDFACAMDINVTLGGTYYGKISTSGSGAFDKINLNVAPVWVSGGRVTIKNGSTILTDQADGTENAKKFPENVGTLNLSWNGATDADKDTITYELYEQVDNGSWNNIYNGTSKSYDRAIGSGASTQGKMYDYYVKAKDSKGVYASGTQDGTQVQKNTLSGSTLASSSSVASNTTSIAFSWNAGSNTDGSAIKYDLVASGVPIGRATNLTGTSLSIAIVDTAPTSGAYILKKDLKSKFSGSSYNGSLSFTLTTKNNYGSTKTSNKSITVDLRAKPTSATPTIDKTANSTAYHTVTSTNISYFVPDGTKKIRVNWTGGSDYLGTALKYDVQVKIGNGAFETKHSNLTGSSCDLVLPKQTSKQAFVVRLITKTAYNYTNSKDTGAEDLHFYSQPSVDLVKMDRTSSSAKATIKLNANTSIPNVNFPTRTFAGASSGTLLNSRENQDITVSGLVDTNKYTWTITVKDDVGLHTANVTKTIEIPSYTPLFSVREKGVGVNAIPDGSADFIVASNNAPTIRLRSNANLAETGGKITFSNGATDNQEVDLQYSWFDSEKAPFGLWIRKGKKNTDTTKKAFLDVEGKIYSEGREVLTALSLYPVGSIYMSTVSTNPSSYFGGTWVAWGAGRVPVGINTGDADFSTVEKTGGAKSNSASHTHSTANHTLTTAQIPAHNHSASTNSTGSHSHNLQNQKAKWASNSTTNTYCFVDTTSGYTAITNKTTTSGGSHSHTVTVNNSGGGGGHNHGNTGSASVSLSAVQPYITCYMWKRTA